MQLDQDNLDFNELMTIKMLMVMRRTKKITTNSRRGDVVASLTISLLIQVTTDHPGQSILVCPILYEKFTDKISNIYC